MNQAFESPMKPWNVVLTMRTGEKIFVLYWVGDWTGSHDLPLLSVGGVAIDREIGPGGLSGVIKSFYI